MRYDMTIQGLEIHKSICAIRLAIAGGGGIGKGRQAPMGYKFRGIEDFDNILCGLTAEHNIAGPYPRVLTKEIVHGTTEKGRYQSHVVLEIEWTYVSALDGSVQVCSTVGEAMDTQDKAFNKAMQASRKYADVMVFRIPVGGDDTEVYVPEPSAPPAEAPHRHTIPVPNPVAPAQAIANLMANPELYGPTSVSAEPAKRTRGPNKPKPAPEVVDAAPTFTPDPPPAPREVVPFEPEVPPQAAATPPGEGTLTGNQAVSRVNTVMSFPLLYAFAQDADDRFPTSHPDREFVFGAIKSRAIGLFKAAASMAEVQEGFEIVSALGQPTELKAAANAAYAKYRK